VKLAISACLLGEKISYDGSSSEYKFITKELSKYFEFVPFCPENLAFSTPRESMRIILKDNKKHIFTNFSKEDITTPLLNAVDKEAKKLQKEELCGIIFKTKSPTCGVGTSKQYLDNGFSRGKTDGVFVDKCRETFPYLPLEDSGRLEDKWLRENFIMQIFSYKRLLEVQNFEKIKELIEFHSKEKFMLLSKHRAYYEKLGQIVANQEKIPFEEVKEKYITEFKKAINEKSKIGRVVDTLEHLAGFFKTDLTQEEKKELHSQIHDFHKKIVPLIVPVSTLKLFAKVYKKEYVLNQTFLEPYPNEFALRSHIEAHK
jgi:uncharacterized protein YbgA (DUF1722 family)/uncharacterized protein YbbK (DUF523 family)